MVDSDIGLRLPGQELALLHRRGGVTCCHRPGFNVRKHARTRSYNSAVPDSNAGRYKHIGCNPRALANHDRRRDKGHGRILIVVAGGTEETVLANCRMRPDANLVHTVAVYVLTQATIIPYLQVPGRPDSGRRIRMDRLSQLGAERSQ